MEGRCAGVENSPSPFSSAASPPCEVGGQSRSGVLNGDVTIRLVATPFARCTLNQYINLYLYTTECFN